MIRTFLAVELSEPVRAALGEFQRALRQRLSHELAKDVRISWVQPASIHLTVKFLGDISEQLVQPMHEAVEQWLSPHRRIEIPLERVGVFPSLQQPRVLWVGPSEQWNASPDAARLKSLHRAVEEACASLDLQPDSRPLSPHLTLARIKDGGRLAGQSLARSGVMERALALGSLSLAAIALMKSELKPTGSVYTRLWEARLEEGRS
ncbi:MAG TPA: RNA 2',3'-cyclic phosphodiesterase [Nitrospira sp.]|nr:RNA 2',3'-cyclic phosphodiesterase [Nitrospira sp.]